MSRPPWVNDYKQGMRAPVRVEVVPDLFPTPLPLAQRMVSMARIERHHRVLEPSAGTGNLLQYLVDASDHVTAVEINMTLVRNLRERFEKGDGHCVVFRGDFLELSEPGGEVAGRWAFDRICANPPFSGTTDVTHLLRCVDRLAPGGRLVALCAAGPRQEKALRAMSSHWEIVENAFRAQGTGVRVALLTVDRSA